MITQNISLLPILPPQWPQFISDLQEAFSPALKKEFKTNAPFPPKEEIQATLSNAENEAYHIFSDGQKIGGAVVKYLSHQHKACLELFFILPQKHGKGLDQLAWQALEAQYPQAKTWELVTPYFEKRNIHFYVNKCGFRIVEFVNKYHPSSNPHYQIQEGENPLGRDEFFRFEKIVNR